MDNSAAVEPFAHLPGMLDRDQRTARTRCSCAIVPQDNTCHRSHISQIHRHIHRSKHHYGRNSGYLRETMRRLQEVLIVGTYLLSIVSIPSSSSAPASRHSSMDDRMSSSAKWVNPCGASENNDNVGSTVDTPALTSLEISKLISNQADIALTRAISFRDEYVNPKVTVTDSPEVSNATYEQTELSIAPTKDETSKTIYDEIVKEIFNSEFRSHHHMLKDQHYSWLPSLQQIPKNLGEPTPAEHLNSLKMDDTLLDIYGYLQRLAVGLEQMVWDQEDQHGPFKDKFKNSELNLRSLLCEIQNAIIERNLTLRPDVTRDIMPEGFRRMNETDRNHRDWLIYRDYMNALEYVVAVFKHFEKTQNAS